MQYILDGKAVIPALVNQWAAWYESADRTVKRTTISEDVVVSTIFLSLDHQFGNGPPLLFETLVLGGEHDGDMWRYSTWQEAELGHDKAVVDLNDPNTSS